MKKGLNAFQLKLIAAFVMVIDHIGALFFPNLLILRIIGRLAFPMFAFFIAEGYRHTRSVWRYLIRLALCAIVFQIPDWFFGVDYGLNIFATLSLGLLAIICYERLKETSSFLSFLAAFACAIVAQIIQADYGAYGVLYVFVFFLTAGDFKRMLTGGIVLHGTYAIFQMAQSWVRFGSLAFPQQLQLYSLLALPLLANYNKEQGRKMKYFFYAFYPGHLIILYAIDWLIHLR